MDEVSKLNIPTSQVRIFNNWRLYFRVSNIAHLTNISGSKIQQCYLNERLINKKENATKLLWPKQQAPEFSTFRIWRQILATIVKFDNKGKLKVKLGNWEINPWYCININSAIDCTKTKLLHKNDNKQWECFSMIRTERGKLCYDTSAEKVQNIKEFGNLTPVDITKTLDHILVEDRHIQQMKQNTSQQNYQNTINEVIQFELIHYIKK
jgi:hypothetical protein